ncbi:MAG: hypothetical protein C4334_06535 [Pyrinomonas sp.]
MRKSPTKQPADGAGRSRLVPLCIAGVICFVVATILGYGAWYLFGGHRSVNSGGQTVVVVQTTPTPVPTPTPESPVIPAPAGEVFVEGGEVVLGDGEQLPFRRDFVQPFYIAETEVTNEQYRDFVRETGHSAPAGWINNDFPAGAANEPVTRITWRDAVAYCDWLSQKLGVRVRLPTEAEWERAAKGKENFRYPWGNEWRDRAADCEENRGRVRAVKSFPENRSPFGAYDMAGNVWEWVADEARDEQGNVMTQNGMTLRVIKGGAATEPRAFISNSARYFVPEDKGATSLGFRYVIERRPPVQKSESKP